MHRTWLIGLSVALLTGCAPEGAVGQIETQEEPTGSGNETTPNTGPQDVADDSNDTPDDASAPSDESDGDITETETSTDANTEGQSDSDSGDEESTETCPQEDPEDEDPSDCSQSGGDNESTEDATTGLDIDGFTGTDTGTEPATSGCDAGETAIRGVCAPTAVLRVTESDNHFPCPMQYEEVGRWRTGPAVVDSLPEGVDAEGQYLDAGWVYLCSAKPAQVYTTVLHNDSGAAVNACDGTVRGRWHVGPQRAPTTVSGVDGSGLSIAAGWMGLCVHGNNDIFVELGWDDCTAHRGSCGAHAKRGAWHTAPTLCGSGVTGEGDSGTFFDTGWMQLCAATDAWPPVDANTLDAKTLFGYQGWFGAHGDGSQVGWMHWAPEAPAPGNLDFEMWPDMSEMGPEERFATTMTMRDGSPADVFSSYQYPTVNRHFRWMAEHGTHGAFLQRFTSEFVSPPHVAFRDAVALHVKNAAEANGRVFAIMYDVSGTDEAVLADTLMSDWAYLVDELRLTESPAYLRHNGMPVLGLWGIGFEDRPASPSQWQDILNHFQRTAAGPYRAHIAGGVPYWWRTESNDSRNGFAAVYERLDTIVPWSVGRYSTQSQFDERFASVVRSDKALTDSRGQGYAPVIWPGFSWANLQNDPSKFNQVPRNGGRFFWHQVVRHQTTNPQFVFMAMFDEVDEATALFKVAPNAAETPVEGRFLTLDADGESLPSDWYLRLTGAATKAFASEIAATSELPFSP